MMLTEVFIVFLLDTQSNTQEHADTPQPKTLRVYAYKVWTMLKCIEDMVVYVMCRIVMDEKGCSSISFPFSFWWSMAKYQGETQNSSEFGYIKNVYRNNEVLRVWSICEGMQCFKCHRKSIEVSTTYLIIFWYIDSTFYARVYQNNLS